MHQLRTIVPLLLRNRFGVTRCSHRMLLMRLLVLKSSQLVIKIDQFTVFQLLLLRDYMNSLYALTALMLSFSNERTDLKQA